MRTVEQFFFGSGVDESVGLSVSHGSTTMHAVDEGYKEMSDSLGQAGHVEGDGIDECADEGGLNITVRTDTSSVDVFGRGKATNMCLETKALFLCGERFTAEEKNMREEKLTRRGSTRARRCSQRWNNMREERLTQAEMNVREEMLTRMRERQV